MEFTPLRTAALIGSLVLWFISQSKLAPMPEPAWLSKGIGTGITAITLFLTFTTRVPAYPAAIPLPLWSLAACFIAIALTSPMLGLLENRIRAPKVAYNPDSLPIHILTNLLGALLATATVGLARRFPGTSADALRFSNDESFAVFLPLSMLVVLYFAYAQQDTSTTSATHAATTAAADQKKYENSLLRWHQFANVLHLIIMTFVATTSFLYVLTVSMLHSRAGQPLPFTIESALTLTLAICFVLACGLPRARNSRSVYLTFLTGTPAILCVCILWISFFQDSLSRNVFAFSVTTLAYATYVTLVVLDLRARGEQPRAHYFTALSFAILLALLIVGIYFS